MTGDIHPLSAADGLARLAAGTLSAEAWARTCLARIEAREPLIHAWAYLNPDHVLEQARALDAGARPGPLHGLPIGIKDVILTEDMPTQHNSVHYQGAHPRLDAACVSILRQAGALIFGKTETVEFAATGRPAPTRNPRDPERTPGGSSSGSAAAVADGHVPVALGTQTGGSILRPASFCGVYGFKPTWNLVSREGAKTFAASLDTIGWFARTAADLTLVHDLFDPGPAAAPLSLAGARVAICRSPVWSQAEPATQAAIGVAEAALRDAGCRVEPLDLPAAFDGLTEAHMVVMRAEGGSALLADHRRVGDALEPSLAGYVRNVHGYTRDDLRGAYDLAADCRRRFDYLVAGFDLVVTPSTVGEAPLGLAQTGAMTFNAIWSLLHVPCANVPGLLGPSGLPVGLTVTGRRFADRQVLAGAGALGRLLEGLSRPA